jgi:hypothetical protein
MGGVNEEVEASTNPEHIVATRNGAVLLKHTILKSDHFPGEKNVFFSSHVNVRALDGARTRAACASISRQRSMQTGPRCSRCCAGCQNTKLLPLIDGCPNFRKVEGLPIFGVAIPTAQGLRLMLDMVRSLVPGGTKLHWSNMREEPLIYISGKPFVVREVGNPFGNLEYTGGPHWGRQ